jgi:hypothetical protein
LRSRFSGFAVSIVRKDIVATWGHVNVRMHGISTENKGKNAVSLVEMLHATSLSGTFYSEEKKVDHLDSCYPVA